MAEENHQEKKELGAPPASSQSAKWIYSFDIKSVRICGDQRRLLFQNERKYKNDNWATFIESHRF